MSDSEMPPNRPILLFLVFGSCIAGLILQLASVINLFQDLCDNVPDGREYCKKNTDNSMNHINRTDNVTADTPIGVTYFQGYRTTAGFVLFTEFLTFFEVGCKVYGCVKFAVSISPKFFCVWKFFRWCGNCWYVMVIVSVCLNISGMVAVCSVIPFSDMINYMDGFRLGFGNVLFGIVRLACWTGYSIYRHSCCPDSDYFLGSNQRLSQCELIVIDTRKK
ncbi:uncharacterized protein LOC132742985 [Ruditapes philippinarum]|uniref:uncharacterized protein LOC132742985 n=1 Tax=Ruditapes philippinarum TaxID=129788 RepID=UPI00295AFE3B|nr:uncharacterized protein LOC132742985 [Ruditapes philippinarum]